MRPKVSNYELTVEKGEGFDLNRSLFERLVLKGYPHETLSMQHRMRPEISAFVRELTYPELIDAPSTHQRPNIRGVHSNIIFVDHNHPEDDDAFVADLADEDTKSSKRNTYEVQMVLKIVRYLAQQGYKSEDIVVLTPYLGQLHQLRDTLKRDKDPILNKLDSLDLARDDLDFFDLCQPRTKRRGIHLATIGKQIYSRDTALFHILAQIIIRGRKATSWSPVSQGRINQTPSASWTLPNVSTSSSHVPEMV